MADKSRINEEKIIACLQEGYGLTVTGIEYLPLGYDAHAKVYRIQANRDFYFLKVIKGSIDERSILIPHYLKEQGIDQVIPPLPTNSQELWIKLNGYTLMLSPFIEGTSGWDTGLSDRQWVAFGAVLKQIHSLQLPAELSQCIPQETFVPDPKWSSIVKQLHAAVRDRGYTNPYERQLATFWIEHYNEIGTILYRAEQLGSRLKDKSLEFVLCHADIHTANLLLGDHGELYIVDWDQTVFAPRERDLMFVTVGGFVTEEKFEALFFQGYGKTEIDPLAMAYYRYARLVEDFGGFAEEVFFMETTPEAKEIAIRWFIAQFAPDGLVEAAHRLDHLL